MEWLETRNALNQGHKLTHKYFTTEQYIKYNQEEDCIETEDGYDFEEEFNYNPMYKIGWEIYKH